MASKFLIHLKNTATKQFGSAASLLKADCSRPNRPSQESTPAAYPGSGIRRPGRHAGNRAGAAWCRKSGSGAAGPPGREQGLH